MRKSVDQFIQNISAINDPDYGDFMRKANHYLIQLENEISGMANAGVVEQLAQMKKEIQYDPNWDIESTRDKAISRARGIEAVLAEEFRPAPRHLENHPEFSNENGRL